MPSASDELRRFARLRDRILAELALCAASAVALWLLAGRLDAARAELQTLFLAAALLFGCAVVRLLPALPDVVAYRCPRCERPFHRLRACRHCGLTSAG